VSSICEYSFNSIDIANSRLPATTSSNPAFMCNLPFFYPVSGRAVFYWFNVPVSTSNSAPRRDSTDLQPNPGSETARSAPRFPNCKDFTGKRFRVAGEKPRFIPPARVTKTAMKLARRRFT
jgi:hypothetical protein